MTASNYGLDQTYSNYILDILFIADSNYHLVHNGVAKYPFDDSSASGGNLYIGLSTTTPNTDGSGFTEPSIGGYTRVNKVQGTDNWNAASNGIVTSKTDIYFPRVTESWGEITHWGAFTASSGGTPKIWGKLSVATTPTAGTIPIISAGNCKVSLVGGV